MSGEMVRNRAGRGARYLPYTGSNAGNPIIPFGWLVSNTEISLPPLAPPPGYRSFIECWDPKDAIAYIKCWEGNV